MKGLWDLIQNLIRDQVIEECAKEIEANAGGSQRSRRLASEMAEVVRSLKDYKSASQPWNGRRSLRTSPKVLPRFVMLLAGCCARFRLTAMPV